MTTSKADSTLAPVPVPQGGKPAPDLDRDIETLRLLLRAKTAQRDAEVIKNRADKAAKREAALAEAREALTCRIYKALWSAKGAKALDLAADILVEFKTDSINQHYTLEAMKARADAATIARAKALADEQAQATDSALAQGEALLAGVRARE